MFYEQQKIGLYTLIRKLAKGGFGEVWLAEKESQFVTKKVAIKLPHHEQVDFEAIRQEATLWEQASGHPNVLPIIDADVYDGQVAIVSEYADGGSLADKLNAERKLPVRKAVEMTVGILNGLEYLHSKNIVHRDIKPANILLQGDTPRLADFGISRALHNQTTNSMIVGTESYMSPESFEGVRSVQTDVWSVGVLLYKLLTGNLPFPQNQPTETMYAVLLKEPDALPGDIPPRLREIVFKALEKDRETATEPPRRYQTAAAMRDDLNNFLGTLKPQTIFDTRETPAAFPTSEQAEEIVTRVRIPARDGNRKQIGSFQSLVKKQSTVAILAAIFGFAAIVWLAVYMFSQSSPAVAEITNSANENSVTANSNAADKPASNSNEANSSRSAFDYFTEANKFYDRKRYDRAIIAYTKAIELNPADYTFYNNRGLTFYKKRSYDEAINDFNRAAEINPKDSSIYSNRGVAYEDGGNVEQAVADYRKAVEVNPEDKIARNNLNKILK
ncbi:MAG TPA: protein kinase [Pyrinomonadaceae bacterium]|nr:protein kinase [Pyrinomonadaceae bacterium]